MNHRHGDRGIVRIVPLRAAETGATLEKYSLISAQVQATSLCLQFFSWKTQIWLVLLLLLSFICSTIKMKDNYNKSS